MFLDADMFAAKVLWCLHYYLYPTARHVTKTPSGNKSLVRYTVQDSQKSFLFMDTTMQALENHLDILKSKKENIQPFILAIGDLNTKFDPLFVYIDNSFIECTNFLKCVDVCFKLFHIFNLQYPKASEHFWTFIANYFFEINNSKKNSKVTILLDELKSFEMNNDK